MSVPRFYDDLAPYYELIFENWEASMARQGDALERLILAELGAEPGAAPIRVLDVAAGIGTQSLPLAQRGFAVTARDVAPGAIARLRREAETRGLAIDAAVADMRLVQAGTAGPFDVVLCADNALPHLLDDAEIVDALRHFRSLLRPGGRFIGSVRDYDAMPRGVNSTHDYGARRRGGEEFRLRQEWTWEGPLHYNLDFIVERAGLAEPQPLLRAITRYYAIGIGRLLELVMEAGFSAGRRADQVFYQPLIVARA